MVAQYERLRGDALEPENRIAIAPGLALFLRQGMTAWMRAWSSCATKPATNANPAPTANSSPLPSGLRTQLAIILAGMILGQQQEITT